MHDRLHPIGKNIELTLWPESSGATRVKLADEVQWSDARQALDERRPSAQSEIIFHATGYRN